MDNNEIIRVDYNDNEIGYATKVDTHKYGWLHRAFSIFIMDGDKMLIHRRHPNKYHTGGLWTNACCSHPRPKEVLSDAIHRRLVEEAGFDCDLKEVFSFVYYSQFAKDLFEYEYDHVFVGEYSGEVNFDKDEAIEYHWIAISDLKKWLEEKPEDFTPWFIIAVSKII